MNHQPSIPEAYTLLRAALNLFQKPPTELDARQLDKANQQAVREFDIETRVLQSQEAAGVIVTEEELTRAFAEVKNRFEDEHHFEQALEAHGLNDVSLRNALARQCKVNAVLEKVATRSPKVSDVEVGIYYHSHPEKFRRPEQRSARHILISINPDYPENTREAATQRINEIAEILRRKPHKFADLAMKYSECPTALNGGDMGFSVRGKLFPELDQVLFEMKAGQLSSIVETEIGLHLIQCLKIIPTETLSLQKTAAKIRQLMQDRHRRTCQKAWLATLPVSSS